jgi:hypothetical protein
MDINNKYYLDIKKNIDDNIVNLLNTNKSNNLKKLIKIFNFFKSEEIGRGHDELLKKQKQNILYYKQQINDIIEHKICTSQKEQLFIIDDDIYWLSLFLNKTEEIEIKCNIKIENFSNKDFLTIFYLIYLFHIDSLKNQQLTTNEELTKLLRNFKHFNDIYISDKIFEESIKNKNIKDMIETFKLNKKNLISEINISKFILIYITYNESHISIYYNEIDKLYYKIEISTTNNECKMYLLNIDSLNIKTYLEKISIDKRIEIFHKSDE